MGLRSSLKYNEVDQFITLPGEKLILARRQHWIVLLQPVLMTLFANFFFIGIAFLLFILNILPFSLVIVSGLFITSVSLVLVTKIITDWYYHLFIITTRKILDVCYTPFSHKIDDVFLDQVRITEIDVKMHNFFYQLLDVGDVVIIFDRPSHEKTFVLGSIHHPRQSGIKLADALENLMYNAPIWFKPREEKRDVKKALYPYQFAEDVERGISKRSLDKL